MKKRIYLDHAATTPVHPDVIAAMNEALGPGFGNPSSPYQEGRLAKRRLEESRESIGACLGGTPEEIFFTGGGTEANVMALRGIAHALKPKGRHLITTAIEHRSILGAFKSLEEEGFEVTMLPVSSEGLVEPDGFRRAIRPDTVFASIMLANNEIGTVQPIARLAAIAREFNVKIHTDAVQALPCMRIDVKSLMVDALTVSAHKVYGPKGIAALYLALGTPFHPLVRGGEQERGVRSGTENVPGIAGFAKAVELLERDQADDMKRLLPLRNRLKDELIKRVPDTITNGDSAEKLPANLNLTFRGVDGESLLIRLDLEGISCSLGSACASGALEPSHVLLALGRSPSDAKSSLRFSLGRSTSLSDIEQVLDILPPLVKELRNAVRKV